MPGIAHLPFKRRISDVKPLGDKKFRYFGLDRWNKFLSAWTRSVPSCL